MKVLTSPPLSGGAIDYLVIHPRSSFDDAKTYRKPCFLPQPRQRRKIVLKGVPTKVSAASAALPPSAENGNEIDVVVHQRGFITLSDS